MEEKRHMWLACLILVVVGMIQNIDCVAVMSIDLGSEYVKVAIVKPGVPMEIVLNKESHRKTPCVVAFRDGERTFGDSALNTAVKFPNKAYRYIRELLGKKVDNPIVQQYIGRFPYCKVKGDEATNTVVFQYDSETSYGVEELLAMMLQNAKEMAETYAEQPIKDGVITVPVYFNQAERRALLRAADLAGINVLQLMNDNSAVALNYGVFRRKSFNSTSQYYMFYDMGATSTTATIVGYKLVQSKERGFVEKNPQVSVKGVGYDRQLGGLEIQLRLRDHLAKLFNAQKKTAMDVMGNPRAMAKLFKEAGRVKQVLSANSEFFAQVESLLDDKDFKAKVTREELESISSDLFDKVSKPVEDALKASHITMDEISEVILMGAGTRMPKVQEILKKTIGREELGKSISTDEAAALGAVYQAAYMTKGFKVLKFGVKDANLFPIQVDFERTKVEDGSANTRMIRRTLFGKMNPFPQKKVMTFNKHTEDFSFAVNYGDLDLNDEEMKAFDSLNLTKVQLKGVGEALNKHNKEAESKGIKAHFRMDEGGLLYLDKVESVFETQPTDQSNKDEESTLSKLGSTISNFFSGKTDEDKEGAINSEDVKEKEKVDPSESKENNSESGKGKKKKKEKTDSAEKKVKKEQNKEESKKEEKNTENKKDKDIKKNNKTDKAVNNSTKTNQTEENKTPPKPVRISEDIQSEVEVLDISEPSKKVIKASRKRISDMKKNDDEKHALQKIKNELETFIFDSKDKQTQELYEKSATEEEKNSFAQKLTEASDWLEYEADDSTTKDMFKDKLKSLKDECKDWFERVNEHNERPQALDTLKEMLNFTVHFYNGMENYTGEDKPFTKVEQETLSKLIKETKDWRDQMLKEQAKNPMFKKAKITIMDIAVKLQALDREVKYLVNKAKTFVPKPKPKIEIKESNKTKKASNETKVEDDNSNSNETKPTDDSPEDKIKTESTETHTINDISDKEKKSEEQKLPTEETPGSQEVPPPTEKIGEPGTSEDSTTHTNKKENRKENEQIKDSEKHKEL